MVEITTMRTVVDARSQERQVTGTAHTASLQAAIDDLGKRIKN